MVTVLTIRMIADNVGEDDDLILARRRFSEGVDLVFATWVTDILYPSCSGKTSLK